MKNTEWNSVYPIRLDTEEDLPTLNNDQTEIWRASQQNSIGSAIRELEKKVGSDFLENKSLRHLAIHPEWNYLDLNMPTGITVVPQYLYQFDDLTTGLYDKSGRNRHLTRAAGTIFNSILHNKKVFSFYGLKLENSTNVFKTSGAITIEMITSACRLIDDSSYRCILTAGWGNNTTNCLYSIWQAPRGKISWRHQYGAGTTVTLIFDFPHSYDESFSYTAMTRNTNGTLVSLYVNGKHIDNQACIASDNGTNAKFVLGGLSPYIHSFISSIRITGIEFSANQIKEAYQRIRGIY